MRILIAAYACEPGAGSEPGVGWNWSVQAARHGHDVHVITRDNNRTRIEEQMRSDPLPNLTFHYIDLPWIFRVIKKRTGYYGLLVYYYLWQFRLWWTASQLHRRLQFDIAHHVTFVIDWMPSGLAGLRIPLIWGPVGGSTHVIPAGFQLSDPRARLYESVRRTIQVLLKWFDPFVLLTRARSRRILAYTSEALAGIPSRSRRKAQPVVHIGVEESEVPNPQSPPEGTFTVLSGGRLVHWKGFDLLMEAFTRLVFVHRVDAHLLITGEGPFRGRLEEICASGRVEDRVSFLGWLPTRRHVYAALERCHLFALPTLRDGPPVSILEAMLASRPILCLDLGATRELVPDGAGFKVPLRDRRQVIDDIAAALASAAENRESLQEMGRRARAGVLAKHDWKRIGDDVERIYRQVADIVP